MRYAVYGIGGFGREVAPLAQSIADARSSALRPGQIDDDVIFVDDAPDRPASLNGLGVIGFEELRSEAHADRHVVVCVGEGRLRQRIEEKCVSAGLTIGTLMSLTACNRTDSPIGPGAVICDNVILTANVQIGKSFQANIYSYVAHDCIIGDYVTFAPRVSCNGNIHIADYAYIGTGAVFTQGKNDRPLTVGEGAIVGMGAVVTKNVDPYTVVTGNPARFLRAIPRDKV